MQNFRLRFLRNLWTFGGPSLTLFFLGMNVCKISDLLFLVLIRYLLKCYSMIAMKILVTFEIFATFADFSRPSWPFSVLV